MKIAKSSINITSRQGYIALKKLLKFETNYSFK